MNQPRSRSLPLILAAVNEKGHHVEHSRDQGFTFVELLVVIAITTFLAATLLPALAASKESTKAAQCMSNTRQLTVGWAMYASDNRQQLPSSDQWVLGQMSWSNFGGQNQNTNDLVGPLPPGQQQPLLGTYLHDPRIFKDPADIYQTPQSGYRVRSYSMNGALGPGSGPIVEGNGPNGNREYYGSPNSRYGVGRNATGMSDLIHPNMVFVFLDEQADSINDGKFMFNPGCLLSSEQWRDLPASYHNGAGCFSFADGHSIIHPWKVKTASVSFSGIPTVQPVQYINYGGGTAPWRIGFLLLNPDYEWMEDHMPYR